MQTFRSARRKPQGLHYVPGERLVNREFDADGEVGIGVPTNAERHVHVLSRVELRDDRVPTAREAPTDAKHDVGVVGVEADAAGRLIRRRAAVARRQVRISAHAQKLRDDSLREGAKLV